MSNSDYASLPLVDPAGPSGLVAVARFRYLMRLLVRRELQARYAGSFLGLIWSYVNPLTQFFIYWFVMGKIMGMAASTEEFAVHIFVGILGVHFFTESFQAGTTSIMRNTAFVQKMALPLELFPVSAVIVTLYNLVPASVILGVACVLSGWTPDWVGFAALLLALGIMLTVGTGCALMFSVLEVLFRDTNQLVGILNNFARFLVPMMYPFTMIKDQFPQYVGLYLANPLADAVLLLQRALWVGTVDDPKVTAAAHFPPDLFQRGFIALGVGALVLIIGQLVFSRLQSKVPERV